MKRLQIIIFITAVLFLAIIAGAEKDNIRQWEYARIYFEPFSNWIWSGPERTIHTEELQELFSELGVKIPPGKSADVYILFEWAGNQGWELVTLEQRSGFIAGWFKRRK